MIRQILQNILSASKQYQFNQQFHMYYAVNQSHSINSHNINSFLIFEHK